MTTSPPAPPRSAAPPALVAFLSLLLGSGWFALALLFAWEIRQPSPVVLEGCREVPRSAAADAVAAARPMVERFIGVLLAMCEVTESNAADVLANDRTAQEVEG